MAGHPQTERAFESASLLALSICLKRRRYAPFIIISVMFRLAERDHISSRSPVAERGVPHCGAPLAADRQRATMARGSALFFFVSMETCSTQKKRSDRRKRRSLTLSVTGGESGDHREPQQWEGYSREGARKGRPAGLLQREERPYAATQ